MLYERWRDLSAERRKDLAVREFTTGRRWTFGELFEAGAARPAGGGPVVTATGISVDFILDILAAWRENKTACPLEPGQIPPDFLPPINCAHLKSTSASGGTPRWVALTAQQLAADADNIVATMGLRADWPNLGVISLAHSYGFSNLVLPLLLHGIPLILSPAPLPEIIRRAGQIGQPLTVAAVPALWRAWYEADAIPASIRLAISAGAPLRLNLEQAVFARQGIKIHNFLGSSECGGIAYDAQLIPRTDEACAGTPLQNVSLSINAAGCLAVRSRAVGESYWPEPSATLGQGLFETTDLAELREGMVYLQGRLGDLINVAGRKISPESIERILLTHPKVRECVVFGTPSRDAERSETIVAMVAGETDETELRQFLLEKLPAWQTPRSWQLVDSLPANGRGKLSRSECRRRWQKETAD
jgi:acyl-coenzyme A synthetase/AMP-(fatty) acid ligase